MLRRNRTRESTFLLNLRHPVTARLTRSQNGGHCQPLVYPSIPAVAKFEIETYRFLQNFVRENNIPCDWVSLTGVHAFLTEDTFSLATAAVEDLQEQHPELAAEVELVKPSGSGSSGGGETLASLRVPTAKGAVIQKNAASLWPYKLVAWVLEQLLDRYPSPGFNLQTNTPVTRLQRQDAPSSDGTPDGRGWIVTTPRGRIIASTVLLCTNGYTSRLLPAFSDLIVPTRGQIATVIPPKGPGGADRGTPAKLHHSYVFLGNYPEPISTRDDYLIQRPLPTGELVFGGGRNFAKGLAVGEWRDDVIEEPVSKWLRGELSPPLDLTPGESPPDGSEEQGREPRTGGNLLDATFEWTGIMGYSRDHHPWVGTVPQSLGGGGAEGGLWICGGFTGHGMPVAALCARSVVQQMVGDDVEAMDMAALPGGFRLTEERLQRARTNFDEVAKVHAGCLATMFP